MASHSSTLAWKIPWTEGPGGLQSMGSRGVRHNWATSLSLFTFMHWRKKWQPTPVFLPGESQGRGSLAAVYGVTQSRTRLKRLSGSSRREEKCRAFLIIPTTSLVAQTIKHLPAMQETQVQSIGWEDLLEKEMATHSTVLAWKIHGRRSLVHYGGP